MKPIVMVLILAACGSTTGTAPPDADVDTVTSITFNPATLMMKRGLDAPKQVMATAMLSSGQTKDITHKVTWASSDPSIAAVADGVVKPLMHGNATITATLGTVSGMLPVMVADPTLVVGEFQPGVATA